MNLKIFIEYNPKTKEYIFFTIPHWKISSLTTYSETKQVSSDASLCNNTSFFSDQQGLKLDINKGESLQTMDTVKLTIEWKRSQDR